GERKGAPHAHIVERLALVVRRCDQQAVPVAFLDGDVLAQSRHEIVTAARWQATELDGSLIAANGLDAERLGLGENGLDAIQIGLSLMMIMLVALARNAGTRLTLVEHEGA